MLRDPSYIEPNLEPAALDLALSSGTVRAYRLGTPGAPAVLCIPGLDANARSFDLVAASLGRRHRDVIVVELRGRGASERTRVGTYGWERHAQDVLEVATQLGHDTFDLVGHSMGALVGMQAAAVAPERVRRLVAIDTAGPADLLALPTIVLAALRLAFVYPATGMYCATVLLVRATRRLPPFGLVVGARLRDAFLRSAASAELVEVDANHYEVMAHRDALRAIDAFLARGALVEANEPLDSANAV
jgi:pimeloyl-ACP methyl ester carboxylesterase